SRRPPPSKPHPRGWLRVQLLRPYSLPRVLQEDVAEGGARQVNRGELHILLVEGPDYVCDDLARVGSVGGDAAVGIHNFGHPSYSGEGLLRLGLHTVLLATHHRQGDRVSADLALQLLRRAVRDYLSLIDYVELATEPVCLLHVLSRQEDSDSFVSVEPFEVLPDAGAGLGV